MRINYEVEKGNTLSTFIVGCIVHSTQIGIGVLGYQRIVAKETGHDAWISVILAGLVTHLTIWVIVKTLARYPSTDLYGIHQDVYGKWLGTGVSLVFFAYFVTAAVIILRTYIEVVQTWIFPSTPTWILAAIILCLAVYTIMGGIRVIAGYTFMTVLVTIWLVLDLYFPLQYAEWDYLFPIMAADLPHLLKGAMAMSLTTIGFEVLYAIYPYVENKQRVNRSVQIGLLLTNLIYVFIMVVSMVFFSDDQLMRTIWATLNLQKMVHFPVLERFELIVISGWVLIVLPNIMLYTWSAARGLKRLFGWNLRISICGIIPIIFIVSLIMVTRQEINRFNDIFAKVGLYMAYVYPYILYLAVVIKQRGRRGREGTSRAKMPN